MRGKPFTLLTRPDCQLCEEFEAELAELFGDELAVEAVHVDAHEAWKLSYSLSIPVLLDGRDQFVCAVKVDRAAVARALRAI